MPKVYLPMSNREAGYCVTDKEQKDYACRYGLTQDFVISVCEQLALTIEPQKTANKTKKLIHSALKEATLSTSGRVS